MLEIQDISRQFALLVASESQQESVVIETVQRYAWLLLAATLVGIIVRRFNIPYAVALVIGGLALEASHLGFIPVLDSEVLLFVFLPPLLFDAAFRIDAREVRSLYRPILVLAVPGVLFTALFVGWVLWWLLDLPVATAILFGTVVAATDPVAVLSVFKQLKVSHRLSLVAEAESLVNDGMAITLYIVLLDWVVTGRFSASASLATFCLEVAGGVAIGCVIGLASSRLTRSVDEHLVEMLLSVSVAYGSYLIADRVGASGALACVAAGFIHGSYGRTIGMSAATRDLLDDLWEFLGFVANAIVFLLLGVSVHVEDLLENGWSVTVAILAVLLARVLVTAGAGRITPWRHDPAHTWREAVLLIWGGLRGALTAALVLALPSTVPYRDELTAMAFGVVLFTLVVQGLTLPTLVHRLHLGRQ
ncbi:MAG: sodium:proton antiporter [Thermomicrobiales bacterium]